jgi:hypothetical protein
MLSESPNMTPAVSTIAIAGNPPMRVAATALGL